MVKVISELSNVGLIIPTKICEALGIKNDDKFLLFGDKNSIFLKRIQKKEDETKEKVLRLLDYFSSKFKEEGITKDDIEREIQVIRNQE
ncbi:MAG: hypothetical protein AB1567_05660 [bacterium]